MKKHPGFGSSNRLRKPGGAVRRIVVNRVLQRDTLQGIFIGIRFTHKGLRRFHERDDTRGLNADHVARIRRVLTALQDAQSARNMDLPGWRMHRLKGDRRGLWSVRVSGNWRIVFRFADGEAVDVDLIDYH